MVARLDEPLVSHPGWKTIRGDDGLCLGALPPSSLIESDSEAQTVSIQCNTLASTSLNLVFTISMDIVLVI